MCWMGHIMEASEFIWTKTRNKWCCFDYTRKQHQCTQQTKPINYSNMASSWCIPRLVCLLLVASSSICAVYSSETVDHHVSNQTFKPDQEIHKLKIIRARLNNINKPAVKTIQAHFTLFNDSVLLEFDSHLPCFCSVFHLHELGFVCWLCRVLMVI